MKTNKLLKSFLKKRDTALVNQFAAIISISIFVIVIFMSVYYIFTSSILIKSTQYDKENNLRKIINAVVEAVNKENYSVLESFNSNNLVSFIAIVDKKSNKYLWSTVSNFQGKTFTTKEAFAIDNPRPLPS